MREHTDFIRQTIADRVQAAANSLCYAPQQQSDEAVEIMRSWIESQYARLYNEGHIASKPTVTAKYDKENGTVDFNIAWPVTEIRILYKQTEDAENSAIDGPAETP